MAQNTPHPFDPTLPAPTDGRATDKAHDLTERLAQSAEGALQRTRLAADAALTTLDDGVDAWRDRVAPAIGQVVDQAEDLAERGRARARKTQALWRERSTQAKVDLRSDIRREPVKALLLAAASGAAVAALTGWMLRTRA